MRRAVISICVGVLCLASKGSTADTRTVAGDLISEELTSFTGLAQTPEANLFSGSLTTPIPIEVPPGRKSLTPKLALVYSSAGGPSPYGYGWDLPIGRIQRSTKWGVPRCTGTHKDDFVLNMPDGTAELVADPAGSTTYRPKVEESYLEAERDTTNSLWVVYDRSGMKYTFGDVASARVSNTTDLCQFTTIWALTRVEDPNGNSMNGDGIVDLVQSGASTWTVYFGSPTGFSTTATTWQLLAGKPMSLIRNTVQAGDYDITNHDTFDINGDGIPDFVDASTSTWQVYLGTPNSVNGGWGFGPSAARGGRGHLRGDVGQP